MTVLHFLSCWLTQMWFGYTYSPTFSNTHVMFPLHRSFPPYDSRAYTQFAFVEQQSTESTGGDAPVSRISREQIQIVAFKSRAIDSFRSSTNPRIVHFTRSKTRKKSEPSRKWLNKRCTRWMANCATGNRKNQKQPVAFDQSKPLSLYRRKKKKETHLRFGGVRGQYELPQVTIDASIIRKIWVSKAAIRGPLGYRQPLMATGCFSPPKSKKIEHGEARETSFPAAVGARRQVSDARCGRKSARLFFLYLAWRRRPAGTRARSSRSARAAGRGPGETRGAIESLTPSSRLLSRQEARTTLRAATTAPMTAETTVAAIVTTEATVAAVVTADATVAAVATAASLTRADVTFSTVKRAGRHIGATRRDAREAT